MLFFRRQEAKDDPVCAIAVGQMPGVEPGDFRAKLAGCFEAVGAGVIVRERIESYFFDLRKPDVSGAGNVAPLPGPHPPVFPDTDSLRLLTGEYRGQEFFLE